MQLQRQAIASPGLGLVALGVAGACCSDRARCHDRVGAAQARIVLDDLASTCRVVQPPADEVPPPSLRLGVSIGPPAR